MLTRVCNPGRLQDFASIVQAVENRLEIDEEEWKCQLYTLFHNVPKDVNFIIFAMVGNTQIVLHLSHSPGTFFGILKKIPFSTLLEEMMDVCMAVYEGEESQSFWALRP